MRHDAVVEVSVETLQNVARLKTSPETPETIYTLVGQATFLVLSSRCYENFLRVIIIIEAFFAKGTRLIASKLGRRWPRLSTMGTSGSISSGRSRRSASSQIRRSCGRCGRPLVRNLIISSLPTSIITVWLRFKSGRSVLAARRDQQVGRGALGGNEKWAAYPV
jgi:hypothetical protein